MANKGTQEALIIKQNKLKLKNKKEQVDMDGKKDKIQKKKRTSKKPKEKILKINFVNIDE